MTPPPASLAPLRFPVPAGPWIHEGSGMLCRLPLVNLRVTAPGAFLRAVERHCDGQTPWSSVRDRLQTRWPAPEVDACLSTLARQGVLVEASQLLAVQARVGWVPQAHAANLGTADELHAFGETARRPLRRPSRARLLRPDAAALGRLLTRRASSTTFADRALRQGSLVNVLCSLYGVVEAEPVPDRHAIPSGGTLRGLGWFLALLRPTEGHAAGLYEVEHHLDSKGGGLWLNKLPGDAAQAWSSLLEPTVLDFAHAVIYPVARLGLIGATHGNRALTLALIDAGHALQNAALAALQEDAATIVRNDIVELQVLSMFGLDAPPAPPDVRRAGGPRRHDNSPMRPDACLHPLPALVLGTRPSDAQRQAAQASRARVAVRVLPAHASRLSLATSVAVAGPITIGRHGDFTIWATGRSAEPRMACVKAQAEAWERIGWATPAALHHARLDELPDAVDPRTLVAYAPGQYARPHFPYAAWSPRRRYPWARATRLSDGAQSWVMAHCVFALRALTARDARRPYTNASTSGVAAYTDPATARSRALIELIERDAFARAWLQRSPPARVDSRIAGEAVRVRLNRLQSAGYRVTVHWLESAWLPTVAVFAQRASTCFTSLTTAAGFGFEEALDSALGEAETRIQQAHDHAPHP
ncbi:MAG: YcaO-like family protein, partial [Gammaproteobacteria bacterium]|nr:YcaO-like family protein [Gammaproteobacteria bacterium]